MTILDRQTGLFIAPCSHQAGRPLGLAITDGTGPSRH